jgi:hypothetical protein
MVHFGSSNTCCEGVREWSADRVCAVWACMGRRPSFGIAPVPARSPRPTRGAGRARDPIPNPNPNPSPVNPNLAHPTPTPTPTLP